MAKTTIYLNKEAEVIYQKAKEYAGDNLSAVIVQGLKLYVEKMEMMTKGMQEIIIFVGKNYLMDQMAQGKNMKFIGMKLASETTQDIYGERVVQIHTLYLTRKGKFLMDSTTVDEKEYTETSNYKIYETFSDVMAAGYPYKLLDEARKMIPEIACEELDV
jgi:hypothetical protein